MTCNTESDPVNILNVKVIWLHTVLTWSEKDLVGSNVQTACTFELIKPELTEQMSESVKFVALLTCA